MWKRCCEQAGRRLLLNSVVALPMPQLIFMLVSMHLLYKVSVMGFSNLKMRLHL